MTISDRVLNVLVGVAEIEEIRHDPDVRLYDLQILDSMKTVELIVALSSEFGVEISPGELDREEWATPRKIISYMERQGRRLTPADRRRFNSVRGPLR